MTQLQPDLRTPALVRSRIDIRRGDFWPLAVIAGLTLLAVTLGIHFSVRSFDHASTAREQTLALNGISQRVREVAQMVVPQTDWDDAVTNLDNRYDESWAETNIGKYLNQTAGFDSSFVLDRGNRPVFASIKGAKTAPSSFDRIAPFAVPLIQSVRDQEARRGPLPHKVSESMISRPIQASALKLIDGDMVIMTATLVQPDFGTAFPAGDRAPIVVTNMAVDQKFLDLFSTRFLFNGVHVHKPGDVRTPGDTVVPAKDEKGQVIAHFAWKPLNPGYTLLRQMLPPIVLVCVVLAIVAFIQLRRIMHFADQLITREAQSLALAYKDVTTGLPNQLSFVEQLELEISNLAQELESLTIHCVGFDGLREIRDEFGHLAVEEFMAIASQRLSAVCRKGVLFARLEGDEFGILSLGASAKDAEFLGKRLSQAMAEPLVLECGRVSLRCAVGSATICDPDVEAAEAHRLAKSALHRAQQEDLDSDGNEIADATGS